MTKKINDVEQRLTNQINYVDQKLTNRVNNIDEKLTAKIDESKEQIKQRFQILYDYTINGMIRGVEKYEEMNDKEHKELRKAIGI